MWKIDLYVKQLTNAVRRLDVEDFKKFAAQYQPMILMRSERVIELTMYKIAANLATLPAETRQRAADWLREHDSTPDIWNKEKAHLSSVYGEMKKEDAENEQV